MNRLMWLWLALAPLAAAAQGPAVNGRLLDLRQEYNDVAAAIDTLVHVYGAERIAELLDPDRGYLSLPPDHRIVLLIWADDEAQVYLNGAPVASTRLTPTRVEIPLLYIQANNELTVHAWDTDRVEAAWMLGLYVEDPAGGLHPVITSVESEGWRTDAGDPAMEIFYTHSVPDLPGAEPMWGPQLFGRVWVSATFDGARIEAAARAPAATSAVVAREAAMDFHRNVGRLLGLEERRGELLRQLDHFATRPDPHLRVRKTRHISPISYTLGQASPFLEVESVEEVIRPLPEWRQSLPPQQRELVLREARVLRGPDAATPVAPLETAKAASEKGDRLADYVPPAEQGEVQVAGGAAAHAATGGFSTRFLLRMGLAAAALLAWFGVASWRWWTLYDSVSWSRSRNG